MDNENNFTPFAVIPMDSPAIQALKNLRLDISGEGMDKNYMVQGNLGTSIPLSENSSFDVGVSGMANKFGPYSQVKPTGVNAAYNWDNNTLALEFSKMSPQQQQIFLNYIKQF